MEALKKYYLYLDWPEFKLMIKYCNYQKYYETKK